MFSVDTTEVKHEAQTETQHPVYAPLPEQWERLVASLQQLPNRTAWVKRRAKAPVRIRTQSIPPYRVSIDDIEQIQTDLAKLHGVPVAQIDYRQDADPPQQLTDWEPRPSGQLIYSAANLHAPTHT